MKKRIIILGGGFGGAYAARNLVKYLDTDKYEITLIDRNNFLIFYPLLIEAGTGSLEPRHAVAPLRPFTKKGVNFKMAKVLGFDTESKSVRYQYRGSDIVEELNYEHLLISLGSVTNMPDIPGLHNHGYELKNLTDAVALRDRAIQMLELANNIEDEDERKELLHFVVAGSNFTGIEAAGEFNAFLKGATKYYPNVDKDDCKITVIEIGGRILKALDEDLADYAEKELKKSGVDIILNDSAVEINANNVVLKSGKVIPAATAVWCAGIAQNPLLAQSDLPKDERGYILTERDLSVKGFGDIWAIGDCAVNTDKDGNPHPATAQYAIRQARQAAKNIWLSLNGKKPEECDIEPKGAIAAIGCRVGVAKIFGIKFSGFIAWFLFRTVYLFLMPGLARKFRVALDWTASMFFRKDYVQLGIHKMFKKKQEHEMFEYE